MVQVLLTAMLVAALTMVLLLHLSRRFRKQQRIPRRILLINASLRGENGYTGALLARIAEGVARAGCGCETETVVLARKKVQRCMGCNRCQQLQTPQCVLRDDAQSVFDAMARADIIVFATPVYVLGMSSLLKTLLERLYGTCRCNSLVATESGLVFHETDRSVSGKPLLPLVVCANVENATPNNTLHFFRRYAEFSDAPIVAEIVRNASNIALKCLRDPSAEVPPRVAAAHRAFTDVGEELARSGKVSRRTVNAASQEFVGMPFFSLIKRLRWRWLKTEFAKHANEAAVHL